MVASTFTIPRNLFPAKVSTAAFLQDLIPLINTLSENPEIDRIIIIIDGDYSNRFGGQPLAVPLCEFVETTSITPEFLAAVNPDRCHFIYAIECASDGLPVLEKIVATGCKFSPIGGAPVGAYVYENRRALETVETQFLHQNLQGYGKFDDPGTKEDFANLCQALEATRNIPGDVVEIGCYRGSSGSVLLDYAQRAEIDRTFYFFDTFDGFDYDAARESSDAMWQGTHATEGHAVVRERLLDIGHPRTEVHPLNIISDDLPSTITQIAVANVDVDLYDAVAAGLVKVAPLVPPGGIIICEDAGHTPNLIGAALALKQFLETPAGTRFTCLFMASGQAFLVAR